jgi:hypothetical protein
VDLITPTFEFWGKLLRSKTGWILVCANFVLAISLYIANIYNPQNPIVMALGWVLYSFNGPALFLGSTLINPVLSHTPLGGIGDHGIFGSLGTMALCFILQWLLIGRFIEFIWKQMGPTVNPIDRDN